MRHTHYIENFRVALPSGKVAHFNRAACSLLSEYIIEADDSIPDEKKNEKKDKLLKDKKLLLYYNVADMIHFARNNYIEIADMLIGKKDFDLIECFYKGNGW